MIPASPQKKDAFNTSQAFLVPSKATTLQIPLSSAPSTTRTVSDKSLATAALSTLSSASSLDHLPALVQPQPDAPEAAHVALTTSLSQELSMNHNSKLTMIGNYLYVLYIDEF